jgi:hypothetical protein
MKQIDLNASNNNNNNNYTKNNTNFTNSINNTSNTNNNNTIDNAEEERTISDLVLYPNNSNETYLMSKELFETQVVVDVVDFIVHPNDAVFYEYLELQETASVCVVIEGFSSYRKTANIIFLMV